MKRLRGLVVLAIAASQAGGGDPIKAGNLEAEKLAGGTTIRWTWAAEPSAVSYDIVGDTLPVTGVQNATCRTAEDGDPTDTIFDDTFLPLPGTGEYVLVGGNLGQGSAFTACAPPAAYFCVRDATGDSFVLKLDDPVKIAHARDVVRHIELDRIHVGATTTGGPVPWNPGWQFHIPPAAVYFFDQSIEICDASIAGVDQGGPPASNWCPWTSEIFGELLQFEQWSGATPEPFYCGPVM